MAPHLPFRGGVSPRSPPRGQEREPGLFGCPRSSPLSPAKSLHTVETQTLCRGREGDMKSGLSRRYNVARRPERASERRLQVAELRAGRCVTDVPKATVPLTHQPGQRPGGPEQGPGGGSEPTRRALPGAVCAGGSGPSASLSGTSVLLSSARRGPFLWLVCF